MSEHRAEKRFACQIVADVREMTSEGFAEADIVQYLKRTYGLD
jgi:cytochrome c-type biogenesis protein CcmH/NrfF